MTMTHRRRFLAAITGAFATNVLVYFYTEFSLTGISKPRTQTRPGVLFHLAPWSYVGNFGASGRTFAEPASSLLYCP